MIRQNYTITEAMELWSEAHPDIQICRQTMHNWVKRFGWAVNADRLISQQKIMIDHKKFDDFNAEPAKYLGKDKE